MIARLSIAIGFVAYGLVAQGQYTLTEGTKLPLVLMNSISTKHSLEGDRVYLKTLFPLFVNGHVVVPVPSYVAGTVTRIKRPGRTKGRGELYVRFDLLMLPNGVTRDFHGRIGQIDGNTRNELDRAEGKVRADGNKAGDARTVGEAAAAGASVGVIAGNAASNGGMGAGIGAAAGATTGMVIVLFSRGPDAELNSGSTVEMVLDRSISFEESEINFTNQAPGRADAVNSESGGGGKGGLVRPSRRWPF